MAMSEPTHICSKHLLLSPLTDKVVIVTGASSDIGRAIAVKYAKQGAKLTLCGLDEPGLQDTLDSCFHAIQCSRKCPSCGSQFMTIDGNLNNREFRTVIINETLVHFKRLDILVANAGECPDNMPFDSVTEKTYEEIMNTSAKALYFLIRKAKGKLIDSKGNIVVIADMVPPQSVSRSIPYSMSKAALDRMVMCLVDEFNEVDVRINAVYPEKIDTARFVVTYPSLAPLFD